ncbi:Adenylate cyclase type 9 [Amphibalanus amphitrite]|uniref:Adenylate cyclase type 9 n=1 Tax=Amphibalanus amphitrite TaxID=1232801 RepID=A0A6A4W7I4_AMPAM|nr:Adenylate cyclase type 9 [Amphibalanus amphitrite]
MKRLVGAAANGGRMEAPPSPTAGAAGPRRTHSLAPDDADSRRPAKLSDLSDLVTVGGRLPGYRSRPAVPLRSGRLPPDIVGFTRMSSNKSAEQLVGLLNDLFGRFDELCT